MTRNSIGCRTPSTKCKTDTKLYRYIVYFVHLPMTLTIVENRTVMIFQISCLQSQYVKFGIIVNLLT